MAGTLNGGNVNQTQGQGGTGANVNQMAERFNGIGSYNQAPVQGGNVSQAPAQGGNINQMPAQGGNINQMAMQGIQGGMAGTAAAGMYQPMQVQAGQLAGTDLSAYTNPYESQVVGQTISDMDRARQQEQMLSGAKMGQAGAFGGSRHGIAEAETNRNFYDRLGSTVGGLRQAGFQNAQNMAQQDISGRMQADLANQGAGQQQANRGLQAANQFANIGNLGFGMGREVNQDLMNQGNIEQLMQQQLIDAAKQQFSGYTGAPADTIGYVSQALGSSTIPQSQTTTKEPGLFDYLSMGTQVAGAMGGMSDMRLKTNIERVGELPNGLGLYTWEWTEDAKDKGLSNSMTLGAIAQEVEAFDPSLTVKTPSGYLAVNYQELYRGL
tara:strand:+ start:3606 stop:4748 length:1143 start_codon:yes stop_codon:yes gene_type:complete